MQNSKDIATSFIFKMNIADLIVRCCAWQLWAIQFQIKHDNCSVNHLILKKNRDKSGRKTRLISAFGGCPQMLVALELTGYCNTVFECRSKQAMCVCVQNRNLLYQNLYRNIQKLMLPVSSSATDIGDLRKPISPAFFFYLQNYMLYPYPVTAPKILNFQTTDRIRRICIKRIEFTWHCWQSILFGKISFCRFLYQFTTFVF